MYTYEEFLLRTRAVVDAMEKHRPTLEHVVHVDASPADEDGGPCAEYRIHSPHWLNIDPNEFEEMADLTIYLDPNGWQIDIDLQNAPGPDVSIPDQPEFGIDEDPAVLASYAIQILEAAAPALRPISRTD